MPTSFQRSPSNHQQQQQQYGQHPIASPLRSRKPSVNSQVHLQPLDARRPSQHDLSLSDEYGGTENSLAYAYTSPVKQQANYGAAASSDSGSSGSGGKKLQSASRVSIGSAVYSVLPQIKTHTSVQHASTSKQLPSKYSNSNSSQGSNPSPLHSKRTAHQSQPSSHHKASNSLFDITNSYHGQYNALQQQHAYQHTHQHSYSSTHQPPQQQQYQPSYPAALYHEQAAPEVPVDGITQPAMTVTEASKLYQHILTPYEQSEILEFPHIYYCGQACIQQGGSKIHAIPHTAMNNGYDDAAHELIITPGDHLEYRYEILAVLGKGSFGQVIKVYDHKRGQTVALKIIRNSKKFHAQAMTEIRILEQLMRADNSRHSNIIRVYGYFYFRSHLCITFELCSINLYEFLKLNTFVGLSFSLIRRFTIQILEALAFLSQHSIIHCDLKPENILLKSSTKSTIKLIDFGSSCYNEEKIFTYIQSRFYRSADIILGREYSASIDMWSLGCIVAELHTGMPLFPGENEAEQLMLMMSVIGPPPPHVIASSPRAKYYFDLSQPHTPPILQPNSRGRLYLPSSRKLSDVVGSEDPNFLSFLRRCLRWDPEMRLTPQKALQHSFIVDGVQTAASTALPAFQPAPTLPSIQSPSRRTLNSYQSAPQSQTLAVPSQPPPAVFRRESNSRRPSGSKNDASPAPVRRTAARAGYTDSRTTTPVSTLKRNKRAGYGTNSEIGSRQTSENPGAGSDHRNNSNDGRTPILPMAISPQQPHAQLIQSNDAAVRIQPAAHFSTPLPVHHQTPDTDATPMAASPATTSQPVGFQPYTFNTHIINNFNIVNASSTDDVNEAMDQARLQSDVQTLRQVHDITTQHLQRTRSTAHSDDLQPPPYTAYNSN